MVSLREIWEALELVVMAFQALSKGDRETANHFLNASDKILGTDSARFPGGIGKDETFWKEMA